MDFYLTSIQSLTVDIEQIQALGIYFPFFSSTNSLFTYDKVLVLPIFPS